jgi:tRNA pseudouridine55 synthase
MDGLLIIDKPEGITSHDVVARVRRILKTRRVGHTGTLDPFATGVMVVLVGKATRLAQFLDKDVKEYEATIRLGFETDTGDRTGLRTADRGLRNEEIAEVLGGTDLEEVLEEFRGEIEQVPPMYSAKKVEGKKLYELARAGKKIERKPIKVSIYEFELLSEEQIRNPKSAIRIRVVCSAGTYIRTLAEDIGKRLGTGAHLEELRRTRSGKFDLSQSITLDRLEKLDNPGLELLPIQEAVRHLPQFILPPDRVEKTKNGLSTRIELSELSDGQAVRMMTDAGELIAVGYHKSDEKVVQPKVVLV